MPAIKIADLEVGQSRVQLRASRDGKSQTIVLAHRLATQPGTRPLLTGRTAVNELLAVLEGRAKVLHRDEGDRQHYLISFDPFEKKCSSLSRLPTAPAASSSKGLISELRLSRRRVPILPTAS